MAGHDVLTQIDGGYRMEKPKGGAVECPDPYYDIMLDCWKRNPETRPTFEFLQDFFDNYLISAEKEYE